MIRLDPKKSQNIAFALLLIVTILIIVPVLMIIGVIVKEGYSAIT